MFVDLLQVISFIVDLIRLPQFPDDTQPTIRQTAISVALGHATRQGVSKVGGCPVGIESRRLGKLLSSVAVVTITGLAEVDSPFLATLDGDWRGTGQRLDSIGSRETIAMVAKNHQEFGFENVTSAGQGGVDCVVGMRFKYLSNVSDELCLSLNCVEELLSQGNSLVLVSEDDGGVRFQGRAT